MTDMGPLPWSTSPHGLVLTKVGMCLRLWAARSTCTRISRCNSLLTHGHETAVCSFVAPRVNHSSMTSHRTSDGSRFACATQLEIGALNGAPLVRSCGPSQAPQ